MLQIAWRTLLAVLMPVAPTLAATPCDVYIVSGQSNMDGRGSTRELTGRMAPLAKPQTNVLICYANPINRDAIAPSYRTEWRPLAPGFSVPPGFKSELPSQRFGPELSFAQAISAERAERPLALIKVTQGGTSLHSDWRPGSGYMYRCLTNVVPVAMKKLKSHGWTGTIKGMIWHQGESDVSLGQEVYRTNLANFIASIRADLKLPALPVAIGEIATNKEASFRQGQREITKEVRNTYFVTADALETVEGTHFTTASVVELGRRFSKPFETGFPPSGSEPR